MIWRDDDILGPGKRLEDLLAVDDLLQRYGCVHTIAVLAETLTPPLAAIIRERRMIAQLHAWSHDDLSIDEAARAQLPAAVDRIADLCSARPTILYPPWNRTSPALEAAAAALGLEVSTAKISLEQYIRAGGDVDCDTINFHFWHAPDAALLEEALQVYRSRGRRMKPTDYCPRAAPFDSYLRNGRALVGVEVGVDAGAHAEALLRHCPIDHLTLIDRWPKDYHYGYCEGRLSSLGFRPRFAMLQAPSLHAAQRFAPASLDFAYIDQEHDADVVTADLRAWWPLLKPGGVLGYRNYVPRPTPLSTAVDAFVLARADDLEAHVEAGEIVLVKAPGR